MMSIRRAATADEARLLGNRFDMIPVANATRCWERECALIYHRAAAPAFGSIWTADRRLNLRWGLHRIPKARQPLLESLLYAFGINCGQTVFGAHNPMCPICGFLG
jgi:hypothetical protein